MPKHERVLYTVISGSHAYGFPSRNSDIDVRRVTLASTSDVFTLPGSKGSVAKGEFGATHHEPYSVGPTQIETVDYEVGRFIHLLVGGNVTAYEMIASPIVMFESPEMSHIRRIGREIACRGQARHHLGLAESELLKAPVMGNDETTLIGYRAKGLLYSLRASFAAIAVINSNEYTVDIQSLYENAKRVDSSFDVGDLVDNLVGYRGKNTENAVIGGESGSNSAKAAKLVLDTANSYYDSEASKWLPDKPNPYTVHSLFEELVEIRREHARLDMSGLV